MVGETEAFELGGGGVAGASPAEPEKAGDHFEVLATGHGFFDGGVLASQPDQTPYRLCFADGVVAGHREGAAVRSEQGGDGTDESRLAGSVGAQEGRHPAGLGDQVEAGQGVGLAVALGEADGFDGTSHVSAPVFVVGGVAGDSQMVGAAGDLDVALVHCVREARGVPDEGAADGAEALFVEVDMACPSPDANPGFHARRSAQVEPGGATRDPDRHRSERAGQLERRSADAAPDVDALDAEVPQVAGKVGDAAVRFDQPRRAVRQPELA